MSGQRPCMCEVSTPEVPPTPPVPYTWTCRCGGFYVPCSRCLEPLNNGKVHGLGVCFAPEPPAPDTSSARLAA